jgi:very-short-patch-repair endonuclease
LVIELDGSQHNTPDGKLKDDQRDKYLGANGLKVIRFSGHNVLKKRWSNYRN